MTDPEELVAEIIAKYNGGNNELMIYRYDHGDWSAELDNPVTCVSLGESTGKVKVHGTSLLDVLVKLRDDVVKHD